MYDNTNPTADPIIKTTPMAIKGGLKELTPAAILMQARLNIIHSNPKIRIPINELNIT